MDHSVSLGGVRSVPLGSVLPTAPTPIVQTGAVEGLFELVLGDLAARAGQRGA